MNGVELIFYVFFFYGVKANPKEESLKFPAEQDCDVTLAQSWDDLRMEFQKNDWSSNSDDFSFVTKIYHPTKVSSTSISNSKPNVRSRKRFFRICSEKFYFDISRSFGESDFANKTSAKNKENDLLCKQTMVSIFTKQKSLTPLSRLHFKKLRRITRNVYPYHNVDDLLKQLKTLKNSRHFSKEFLIELLKKCRRERTARSDREQKLQRKTKVRIKKSKDVIVRKILRKISQTCLQNRRKRNKAINKRAADNERLPGRKKRKEKTTSDWLMLAQICKLPKKNSLKLKLLSQNSKDFINISKNESNNLQIIILKNSNQFLNFSVMSILGHDSTDNQSSFEIRLQLLQASFPQPFVSGLKEARTTALNQRLLKSNSTTKDSTVIECVVSAVGCVLLVLLVFGCIYWRKRNRTLATSIQSEEEPNSDVYCEENSTDAIHQMALLQKNSSETSRKFRSRDRNIETDTLSSQSMNSNNSPKQRGVDARSRRRSGKVGRNNNYTSTPTSDRLSGFASGLPSRVPLVDKFNQKVNNPYQTKTTNLTQQRLAVTSYPPLVGRPQHALRSHRSPRIVSEAGRVNIPPNRSVVCNSNGQLTTISRGELNVQLDTTPTQSSLSLHDSFRYSPPNPSDSLFRNDKKQSGSPLSPRRTCISARRHVDLPPEYSDPPSYYSIST